MLILLAEENTMFPIVKESAGPEPRYFQNIPVGKVFWLPDGSQDKRVAIKHFIFTKVDEKQGRIDSVVMGKASPHFCGELRNFDSETIVIVTQK
jgi:hypothetical protein